MITTKKNKKLLLILLLPVGILFNYSSSYYPYAIEKLYSVSVYKKISQFISTITGFLPFSLAETIIILLIIYIILIFTNVIIKSSKNPNDRKKVILHFMANIVIFMSIIYFVFIVIWGLNYSRLPFSKIAGLEVKPASLKELEDLCESLIERTNKLRVNINEDSRGIMHIERRPSSVLKQSYKGYEKASQIYPELGGSYGSPKGVILSVAMSYAGISGVYFPYTAEANVNTYIPDSMLPSTACHEMAHQRGFAREDEANYIAYLTCSMHPDADFQYSGTLLALINSMNALYGYDEAKYMQLRAKYSDGVRRDLSDLSEFWRRYEGPIEKISDKINDTYLKANKQSDGVYSYGRMVDLLIAEYRNKVSR